jgi:hypothetical protein
LTHSVCNVWEKEQNDKKQNTYSDKNFIYLKAKVRLMLITNSEGNSKIPQESKIRKTKNRENNNLRPPESVSNEFENP